MGTPPIDCLFSHLGWKLWSFEAWCNLDFNGLSLLGQQCDLNEVSCCVVSLIANDPNSDLLEKSYDVWICSWNNTEARQRISGSLLGLIDASAVSFCVFKLDSCSRFLYCWWASYFLMKCRRKITWLVAPSVSICYEHSLKVKSWFTCKHSEQRSGKAQTHARIPPPPHTHTHTRSHTNTGVLLALVSNQIRVSYANISKKHRPFLWRAFLFNKVNGSGQEFSDFFAGVPLNEI